MNYRVADIPPEEWSRLRRVGFWRSEYEPALLDPRELIVGDWPEDERRRLIEYLEASYMMPYVQAGPSWCRCGCSPRPPDIGSGDLTDGTWIFPEGLVHYVRVHCVRPHEDFMAHVRGLNFTVPSIPVGA